MVAPVLERLQKSVHSQHQVVMHFASHLHQLASVIVLLTHVHNLVVVPHASAFDSSTCCVQIKPLSCAPRLIVKLDRIALVHLHLNLLRNSTF